MERMRLGIIGGCAVAILGLFITVSLSGTNHNSANSFDAPLSQEILATSISERLEALVRKTGFVDRVEVSVQNCNFIVETHYNRPCNSEWNGALLSRTIFADMHEMSGRPDDLQLFSPSESDVALIWKLLAEEMDNSTQGKTVPPNSARFQSHIIRRVCLAENRKIDLGPMVYIGLKSEASSDLLSDILSYKNNFCVNRED